MPFILFSFFISPLKPNGNNNVVKISFFKREGIMEKISYERFVYESVDDKSLS